MFPFQRNCSVGVSRSADEKYHLADTDVVRVVKYLVTNFGKTRKCVAVVCVTVY